MSDRQRMWDERYAASDRVWSAEPNAEVERILRSWPAGAALDLGAGEGRHAIWLAERGWRVTAVDFSSVGLDKGREEARRRDLSVSWVVADVLTWAPPAGTRFDLVLAAYLHLPEDVLSRAGTWLAPGGSLVVVGHSLRNLTEGVGGPSDPNLLHTLDQLRSAAGGLDVHRCEEIIRPTVDGDAIDAVLVATRPGA